MGNLTAALAYTNINYPIFPIRVNAKTPLTLHGFKDATTDQAQVKEWWSQWPDANIGLATGKPSGISVVDVDGQEGVDSIKMLGLPKTWTVRTPRGTGYHLYFQYTPDLHLGRRSLLASMCGTTVGTSFSRRPTWWTRKRGTRARTPCSEGCSQWFWSTCPTH